MKAKTARNSKSADAAYLKTKSATVSHLKTESSHAAPSQAVPIQIEPASGDGLNKGRMPRDMDSPIDMPLYFTVCGEWPDEQLLDYIVEFLVNHNDLIRTHVFPEIIDLPYRVNLALVLEVCERHMEYNRLMNWDYKLSFDKEARPKRPAWHLPFPALSGLRPMNDEELFQLLAIVLTDHQVLFRDLLPHLEGWDRIRLAECLVIAEYKAWLDGLATGYDDHQGTWSDPTHLQKLAWEEMARYLGVDKESLLARHEAQLSAPAAAA